MIDKGTTRYRAKLAIFTAKKMFSHTQPIPRLSAIALGIKDRTIQAHEVAREDVDQVQEILLAWWLTAKVDEGKVSHG